MNHAHNWTDIPDVVVVKPKTGSSATTSSTQIYCEDELLAIKVGGSGR